MAHVILATIALKPFHEKHLAQCGVGGTEPGFSAEVEGDGRPFLSGPVCRPSGDD